MEKIHENKQNQLALRRYRILGFVEDRINLGETLAQALREASLRPWTEDERSYSARTIEEWWYDYKQLGFNALVPKQRSDHGQSRVLNNKTGEALLKKVSENEKIPFKTLYYHLCQEGWELPSLSSLYRYLKKHGYDRKSLRQRQALKGPTKAFEVAHVNELWMADFSPGPYVVINNKNRQVHLCILIDDHSRLITFGGYFERANTESFHHCLKEALIRRGRPERLYCDNGGPFVNNHTRIVCANLGIRLLHHKPYQAWQKGKVERVIKSVQQSFETSLLIKGNEVKSLENLNKRLGEWIENHYHQNVHSSTGETPFKRFMGSVKNLRFLDQSVDESEQLFYTRIERTVRKDGTVTINRKLYEVNLALKMKKVELRYNPFEMKNIEVWYQDAFQGKANAADLVANAYQDKNTNYEKRG